MKRHHDFIYLAIEKCIFDYGCGDQTLVRGQFLLLPFGYWRENVHENVHENVP